jgi:hypothetical protein
MNTKNQHFLSKILMQFYLIKISEWAQIFASPIAQIHLATALLVNKIFFEF